MRASIWLTGYKMSYENWWTFLQMKSTCYMYIIAGKFGFEVYFKALFD